MRPTLLPQTATLRTAEHPARPESQRCSRRATLAARARATSMGTQTTASCAAAGPAGVARAGGGGGGGEGGARAPRWWCWAGPTQAGAAPAGWAGPTPGWGGPTRLGWHPRPVRRGGTPGRAGVPPQAGPLRPPRPGRPQLPRPAPQARHLRVRAKYVGTLPTSCHLMRQSVPQEIREVRTHLPTYLDLHFGFKRWLKSRTEVRSMIFPFFL